LGYRRAAILSCLALALGGCQGGGANPPSLNTGIAPPQSVTNGGSVTPAGGSVTTTLGTQSVVITAPPGALSGTGTLSVTVFANNAAPKTLQSAGRKVQKIGASAVLVVEFTVTLTGATLLKPLQASLTTTAAASGSIFRLAGLGTAFDDVDTVTFAAGKASTDGNVLYSRMSLASGTYYAFYVEASSDASAASTPVVTVTSATANPVGMLGTAQIVGAEAQPNGFPYLDPTFTYVLDNATIGSVNAAGLFTAGTLDGAGNVTVTDTTAGRGNPSGKSAVTVSSQRPGNVGDAFSFTGTLTSTIQLVNSNPTKPQVDTATVALTSTVLTAAVAATPVPSVMTTAHSDETDSYTLETVKTGTNSGYAYVTGTAPGQPATLVPGAVGITGSLATDSNGVKYQTLYDPSGPSGNGILDVIPETTGPFGPNNAVLQYDETDQGGYARHRTVVASGAYVETGTDAVGDVQTITVNPDLSASYDARQYSGYRFTMTAPTGSPAKIILRLFNSAGTQLAAYSITPWFPAGTTQPSTETDVDNGSVTYPAACNVPAKYGTAGNQIVQTITRVDPALGNSELMTTTTYMAPRVGPVCIQMSDSVKTFYDYTLQNGFVILVGGGTTPIQLTSVNETLTLQSATVEGGTATLSGTRKTSALSTSVLSTGSFAASALARSRFEHVVREKTNWMRTQTFNRNFLSQGVKTL
jgi:hypothetical protein